jgi:hypothetical protein
MSLPVTGGHIALKADGLSAPSLMARLGQQFLVFVFPHLFSAFLDDAAQPFTPPHRSNGPKLAEATLNTAVPPLSTVFLALGISAPTVV